ncbi:hypothetical protein MRX96_011549 [Rhipicephalus microplus]
MGASVLIAATKAVTTTTQMPTNTVSKGSTNVLRPFACREYALLQAPHLDETHQPPVSRARYCQKPRKSCEYGGNQGCTILEPEKKKKKRDESEAPATVPYTAAEPVMGT